MDFISTFSPMLLIFSMSALSFCMLESAVCNSVTTPDSDDTNRNHF